MAGGREPRGSCGPPAPQALGGGAGGGQQAALLLRARRAAPPAAARGGCAWAALLRHRHACPVEPPEAKGKAPLPPLTPAGWERSAAVTLARDHSCCVKGIRKTPSTCGRGATSGEDPQLWGNCSRSCARATTSKIHPEWHRAFPFPTTALLHRKPTWG